MDTELEKKWDTDDILNNHEKHSEQCWVHPVMHNVLLLFLVLIYLIQSKVAVAFHVLKTRKMNMY